MRSYLLPLLAGASCIAALPATPNAACSTTHPTSYNASTPTATTLNGTYVGVHSEEYNQDFFLGMPFAQPPVNNLRLRTPVSLNSSWTGTKEATAYPPECVGYGSDDTGYATSEDCLYLNVIRPSGLNSSEPLPVAVWIHGGGLFEGGTPDRRYNLSFIVDNSVAINTPILAVSIQYRLAGWGFLGGQEVLDAGSTNLGFRDQRLALHWIQENIAAFGGDPSKVTIWGESAGGQSVGAQLMAYNGRDDGLFRAAIAESGGPAAVYVNTPGLLNSTQPQINFDYMVNVTGCSNATDKLECLRELPFDTYNNAQNTSLNVETFWAPIIDNDFTVGYPSDQLAAGNFVHVPLIIGANTDEGSAFGASYVNVSSDEEFVQAIQEYSGLSLDYAEPFLDLYPNDDAVGIPSLETCPWNLTLIGYGTQARRSMAYFGDQVVHGPRRSANLAWASHDVDNYSYRFNVVVNGIPNFVGATHFQEVAFVFDNVDGLGYSTDPIDTEAMVELAKYMSNSWVGFIHSLDPNANGLEDAPYWPAYTIGDEGVGQNIVFDVNGTYAEVDDYRAAGIAQIAAIAKDGYGR